MAERLASGFGPLLRRLRAEAGLTQEELADAARVSPRTVSDLERGIGAMARSHTARLLAEALGLAGSQRRAFEAAARGRADAVPAGSGDDVILPGGFPAVATRTLPRDIAAFTGRAAELARLADDVSEAARGRAVQIVAVGGMAGIGRTTLSVHAARQLAPRFADGQYFVPLHGHTPGQPATDPADALADLLLCAGHQQALALFRDAAERIGEAEALNNLGELLTAPATTRRARDCHDQALAVAHELGAPLEEARAPEGIGRCNPQDSHTGEGAASLQQALTIYQAIGAATAAQRVQQAVPGQRPPPASAAFAVSGG